LACLHVLVIPPAGLTPYGHTDMCVVCPHDSAGDVRVMWMYLIKMSPFPYDLLAL